MSDEMPTLNIDMDKACAKCGTLGATPSGLCIACAGKRITAELLRRRRAAKGECDER